MINIFAYGSLVFDAVRAQAYVFRDKYRFLLTDNERDVGQYYNEDLQTFMSRYQGFNRA
jgi:hypothetical protein